MIKFCTGEDSHIIVTCVEQRAVREDDRPRVVKMWRENGVFVADVYQGTEDF